MHPFEQTVRGAGLRQRWNDDWNFVIMEEDRKYMAHPEGLGDFAEMNRLITATNVRAFELLRPLFGDAAEVLHGRFDGRPIWFFNVIRLVDRRDFESLEDSAVFRVNPTRFDILCGAAFKEAVENSGLKGLKFRSVDQTDPYGIA